MVLFVVVTLLLLLQFDIHCAMYAPGATGATGQTGAVGSTGTTGVLQLICKLHLNLFCLFEGSTQNLATPKPQMGGARRVAK